MKVFVDASAFVALYHKDETNHQRAVAISRELLSNRDYLYTSYTAILESATVIRKRVGADISIEFLEKLDKEDLGILEDSPFLRAKSQMLFKQNKTRDLSLFDCLDFILFEFYELDAAFTFDKHYQQMGLKTL